MISIACIQPFASAPPRALPSHKSPGAIPCVSRCAHMQHSTGVGGTRGRGNYLNSGCLFVRLLALLLRLLCCTLSDHFACSCLAGWLCFRCCLQVHALSLFAFAADASFVFCNTLCYFMIISIIAQVSSWLAVLNAVFVEYRTL